MLSSLQQVNIRENAVLPLLFTFAQNMLSG